MQNTVVKNSKKGFSLPLAIAISCFLILISSSLLFIALNSMSTTSVDISGRQAYMNVKSALEYARSYYSTNVDDYSTISVEYMVMKDPSGTTSQGADITKNVNETKNAVTYVHVEFVQAVNSNPATLHMTAYSRYSDAYGNKNKMARLSVSFTVGSSGPNRLTIPPGSRGKGSDGYDPSITLNVKKPTGMDYELTYYIWTYRDDVDNGVYRDYDESNGDNSYFYDSVIKSRNEVQKLNDDTSSEAVKPNAEWRLTDDESKKLQQGPNGILADMGNGWFTGEYFVKPGLVPWFNIIFARQGSLLCPPGTTGGAWNVYDSQTNEMFHLWYLDSSDRNIYFEFFDTPKSGGPNGTYYTQYFKGPGWDGKKGLEDTVLVYVKNPKTTVHFRMKGIDDNAVTPSIAAPSVSYANADGSAITGQSFLHSGNKTAGPITMEYEGCGWWAANIETNKDFNITFSAVGSAKSAYGIENSSEHKEFFFVFNGSSLEKYSSENDAMTSLGKNRSKDEYVTIHAKIADFTTKATPSVRYGDVGLNSTSGRNALNKTCSEAGRYDPNEYTPESFQYLTDAIIAARALLDDKNFIVNQPGPTDSLRIQQADEKYYAAEKVILDIINGTGEHKLVPRGVTGDDLTWLNSLVVSGDNTVTAMEANGSFDYDTYKKFIGEGTPEPSAYQRAKTIQADYSSTTIEEVNSVCTALSQDLQLMNNSRIYRNDLKALLDLTFEFYNKTSSDFEEPYLSEFKTAYDEARAAKNLKFTSQTAIDNAKNNLQDKYTALTEHAVVSLDTSVIDPLIDQARTLLPTAENPEKVDCTEDTFTALDKAVSDAVSGKSGGVTTQSELNALADKLDAAIKAYTIKKPAGTISQIKTENKSVRLWIIDNSVGTNGMTVERYPEGSMTSTPADDTDFVSWGKPEYKCSYVDISKELYSSVAVKVILPSGVTAGSTIKLSNVADDNLVAVINDINVVSFGKMVTVYSTLQGDALRGEINDELVMSTFEDPYTVFKYVYVQEYKNSEFKISTVTGSATGGDPEIVPYTVGKLEPGEYIFLDRNIGTEAPTVIPTDDVYPKYGVVEAPPEDPEPEPEPTLANEDDLLIGDMYADGDYIYFTDNDDGYGLYGTVKAYFWNGENKFGYDWPGRSVEFFKTNDQGQKIYKVIPPSGAKYVIFNNNNNGKQTVNIDIENGKMNGFDFYKNGTSGGKHTVGSVKIANQVVTPDVTYADDYIYITNNYNFENLHIYFFDGTTVGAAFPGYQLTEVYKTNEYNQTVYKIKPPAAAKKFVVNNGTSDKQTKDISFTVGNGYYFTGGSGSAHDMQPWPSGNPGGTGGSTGGTGGGTYSQPGVNEADYNATDYKMAFVGGFKVRVQNKSYMDVYGEGNKLNSNKHIIGSGNRFGGTNGNEESDGRLGLADLSPYFDWYDFKIPVSSKATYTFTLTGMNPSSPTTQTKMVKNAVGDVWLEMLSNYNGGSGHYQNLNLYTFDPEEDQIGDNLTVYFRLPEGWSNLTATVNGPFISDPQPVNMTNHLTRYGHTNYYYLNNISKNSPFITFNVNKPAEGGTSTPMEFKTSLRGGSMLLFDPEADDEYGAKGAWVEFESDQMKLKKAIQKLRSSYYGCNLIGQYNDEGGISSSSQRYYSNGLLNMYSNYSTIKETSGGTFFITTNVDSWSEGDAYSALNTIEARLTNYTTLYSLLGDARSAISAPLSNSYMTNHKIHGGGGGNYPEYLASGLMSRRYTNDSMESLKRKMAAAEEVFLNDSTNAQLISAIDNLKRAIDGLETESEGGIILIFYDAQKKVDEGSNFKVRYTLSSSVTGFKEEKLTEYNPERYPCITLHPGVDTIYNVEFLEKSRTDSSYKPCGKSKSEINMDEVWVYVDTASNPYWSKNTTSDYREITTDIFVQDTASETQMYNMKKSSSNTYQSMTLLFNTTATVELFGGDSYVIKAGSYFFDNADVKQNEDSPVYGSGKINLFSQAAKNYFTQSKNIGDYVEGEADLNGKTIGAGKVFDASTTWHNGFTFQSGTNTAPNGSYVNITADSGNLAASTIRYDFFSNKGLSFRWDSTDPLYTKPTVKMYATEFKFAFEGTLDGASKSLNRAHFYLYSCDNTANSMIVEFRTDIAVKYRDEMGKIHNFGIREGKYLIEKSNNNSKYIADLYDETYWKSFLHVKYIGRATANEGGTGTGGSLKKPTYSN